MGEVYRARDSRLGREVAVKLLPEHLASDQRALARFEREAKALAAISHPNILTLFDFGTDQGLSFTVTELLEGETLRSRLQRAPLEGKEALAIATAVAEGLAAAHAKGVIHRDLKPENVFILSTGIIKILDFGLARVQKVDKPLGDASTLAFSMKTEPGVLMGTVYYMAPEQVRGLETDARCDIFSFGCMLYEMLTGTRAFDRPTLAETMAAILRDVPPELATTANLLRPKVKALVKRCLEKNPDDRIQSAGELVSSLKAVPVGQFTTRAPRPEDSDDRLTPAPTPSPWETPRPDPAPSPAVTETLVPDSRVQEVWSRRAEWGPNLVVVGIAGLVFVWLIFKCLAAEYWFLSFDLTAVAVIVLLFLSYPILITLEAPARLTPERAAVHFYDALSHFSPHYRRMWLLLSERGRRTDHFSDLQGFKFYWKARLEQIINDEAARPKPTTYRLDELHSYSGLSKLARRWFAHRFGERSQKLNFLKFEVAEFKCELSAGKTAVKAEFLVNVFPWERPGGGPIEAIRVETTLTKGPDQMWYLDLGTLPGERF